MIVLESEVTEPPSSAVILTDFESGSIPSRSLSNTLFGSAVAVRPPSPAFDASFS